MTYQNKPRALIFEATLTEADAAEIARLVSYAASLEARAEKAEASADEYRKLAGQYRELNESAERERDGWFSAWESASAAELRERARAERAEDRAEALHVDFATAAFAWEKERAELQARADNAEADTARLRPIVIELRTAHEAMHTRALDAEADAENQFNRADDAETRAAAWWEAAKRYCRALNFAWDDIAEYETRAEKAEAKYCALYGEFEDAARSWEVERVTLEDRADKAEDERDVTQRVRELWRRKAVDNTAALCQMREVIRELEAEVARLTTAPEPKPRAFRDRDGDVWTELADGRVKCLGLAQTLSLDDANECWGPLTEITEG